MFQILQTGQPLERLEKTVLNQLVVGRHRCLRMGFLSISGDTGRNQVSGIRKKWSVKK